MLTNKEKNILLAKSNKITIKYNVGKSEITDSLISMLDKALNKYELIKVVINKSVIENVDNFINEINTKLKSELVKQIGRVAIIYRFNKLNKNHILN